MDIFDTPLDENLALEDRSKMIATLVKRAQAMHGELGDDSQGESKREATPRKKTPFEKALERCGEEYIALPNRLNTIPLDEELFKSIHLEIPLQ